MTEKRFHRNHIKYCSMIFTFHFKLQLVHFLIIFLFPFSFVIAASEPTISIENNLKKVDLTTNFLIYEDKTNLLSISDFTEGKADSLFSVNTQVPPNKGYLKSSFWLKINVKPEDLKNEIWYLEIDYPLLDSVSLFIKSDSRAWKKKLNGDRMPYHFREIPHRNLVFHLELKPNQINEIYLKIRSEGSLNFPITLWNAEEFRSSNLETQLVLGIYYGISIALILFNLLLFFSIRDINYFYYVCYNSCYMLLQLSLNGLAFQFLWPDSPYWSNIATPIFIGLSLFTVILFSNSFLRVKDFSLTFYRYLNVLKAMTLAVALMPFLFSYQLSVMLSAIIALFVAPSVLICAFMVYRNGYRTAKYFIIAWTVLLIGIFLYALKNLGAIPVGFFSNYSIQIGSALEVILLSLALADRINSLKQEIEQKEIEKKWILREKFTLARQLSVGILHQMRQPLQVLKSYLELMTISPEKTKRESDRYIEQILISVDKIDLHLKELEKVQNTDHFETSEYTKDEEMADLSGKT